MKQINEIRIKEEYLPHFNAISPPIQVNYSQTRYSSDTCNASKSKITPHHRSSLRITHRLPQQTPPETHRNRTLANYRGKKLEAFVHCHVTDVIDERIAESRRSDILHAASLMSQRSNQCRDSAINTLESGPTIHITATLS